MTKETEILQSRPLHIENTVLVMGKKDLHIDHAFHTYREMKYDGVIAGSLSFLKGIIAKNSWKIGYHEESTQQEKRVIDALNRSLEREDSYTKLELLNHWLQMLDYGVAPQEVVLERVNGINVFKTISPIHPTTISKWKFRKSKLVDITLGAVENDGLLTDLSLQNRTIKGEKIVLFRNEPDSDFPLGKSILNGAYTSWKTKKILQEYEAIGVAKNLSGVLHISVPTEYMNKYLAEPNSVEAMYVDNLITQSELLHAGKGSFILTASETNANGVKLFDVQTVGGSGGNAMNYNVDAVIERYNREMLLALQTTVLATGANGEGGSFALSDNQTNLMTLFVNFIQKQISSAFKKAIRLAFTANGLPVDRVPEIEWQAVQEIDWEEFTRGWGRLIQAGGVTKDRNLEGFLRKAGNAPAADYNQLINTETKADSSERMESSKEY